PPPTRGAWVCATATGAPNSCCRTSKNPNSPRKTPTPRCASSSSRATRCCPGRRQPCSTCGGGNCTSCGRTPTAVIWTPTSKPKQPNTSCTGKQPPDSLNPTRTPKQLQLFERQQLSNHLSA